MFLQRLVEYARRVSDRVPPEGYVGSAIKWIIPLDTKGNLLGGFVPTVGRGGRNDRGKEYFAPHRLRTSTAIRPKLLADNAEYVLGIARAGNASEKGRQRAGACHEAFVQLVRECAEETGEPSVHAVLRYLDAPGCTRDLPEGFDPSHNLTFSVDTTLPIHLERVQQFWADYFWKAVFAGEGAEEDEQNGETPRETSEAPTPPRLETMKCLVCGKLAAAVPRHPFQIKGIPGRPAGAALVSAYSPAVESYGLEASLIAPTCRHCAEAYVKAANLLIEGRDATSLTVGPCVYIFWTKDDCGFQFATLLSAPQPADVKALISSASSGKRRATSLDPTPFYAAALTANRSRAGVRDWIETTIEEVKRNLARWFALQSIVGEWGETDAPPFPIQGYLNKEKKRWVDGLAESLVPLIRRRRDIRQLNPNAPKVLLHAALNGGPLPSWMLFQAIKRTRAEQGLTHPRAALIKMALLSNQPDNKEDSMTELDPQNRDPAYLCGRLLAVLEDAQESAIHVNTVVARFYGTASSAPATVFGTLLRGAQAHLGKLRKERKPAHDAIQQRLEEVLAGLPPRFPAVLTLPEQGLFALGYWHQHADDRARRRAHGQATKKTASESATGTESDS